MPGRNNNANPNPNHVPVMTDGVFSDDNLDMCNPLTLIQAYDLGFILKVINPEVGNEYIEKQQEVTVHVDLLEVPLKVADRSAEAPKIQFPFDKNTSKIAEETIRKSVKALYKYIDKMGNDRKAFNKQIKAMALWNDMDKGNMLEAVSELPILTCYKSQLSGASPDIFRNPDEDNYLKPEQVLNTTRKYGIQRTLMDFYESGANLAEIEMWKNKEKKVSWDSYKEKKYLAYFYENLGNLVKNFETLQKLPDEIQTMEGYSGNALEHLTSRGQIENRSIATHIGGAKWMMKAIENGWSSEGLAAINIAGLMDGAIQKTKYDYEFEGDIQKLKALEEWEKRVFIPFKNEILSKKITKASDMKECIDKIIQFDQQLSQDPYIQANQNIYIASFKIGKEVIIPKAKNRIIDAEDREAQKHTHEIGITENDVKRNDISDGMASILENLKTTNDPKIMEQFASAYINYMFLNGKIKAAHPELFDPNNANYKATTDQLVYQCENYAKELISKIRPENGAELADMLEFGDHGPYLSDIQERIVVNSKKGAMDDFITGKLNGKKPEKSVADVVSIMKEADRGVYSLNARFKDTMNALGKIEEYRVALANDIRKKNLSNGPLIPDAKKMRNLEKSQSDALKTINSYLTDKMNKITERGGDPNTEEGIELLGENGAKRFRAMKLAKKSLLHSIKSFKRFKDNIPTERERDIISTRGNTLFNIDGNDFRIEATNEMFRRETEKILNAGVTEYENRVAENQRFEALDANEKAKEDVIKAHNNLIIDSAKKSMYCDIAMKMTADVKAKILKELPKKYEYPEVKADMTASEKELAEKARNQMVKSELKAYRDFYKKVKNELNTVSSSVNDLIKIQDGKYTFNTDSEQFTIFNNILMNNGKAFGDKFKAEILEENKKGNILPSNISKVRDSAINKTLQASKEPADRNKIKTLCEAIGSNAYKQFIANEEAAKQVQHENAHIANNGPHV